MQYQLNNSAPKRPLPLQGSGNPRCRQPCQCDPGTSLRAVRWSRSPELPGLIMQTLPWRPTRSLASGRRLRRCKPPWSSAPLNVCKLLGWLRQQLSHRPPCLLGCRSKEWSGIQNPTEQNTPASDRQGSSLSKPHSACVAPSTRQLQCETARPAPML